MPFDLKKAIESDATTIVLSFGSAGNDRQQKCPNFASTIAASERIDVLNFDTAFPQDSCSIGKLGNTNLYFFRQAIDEKLEAELKQLIKNATEAGKKIVILEHRAPNLEKFIIELGKQYNDKIGTQIEIIGSYFQDIPVFRYNKCLFQSGDAKTINDTLVETWQKWRERHDPTLPKDQQYNVFSTEQLQQWRKQSESTIGTLYRNLASIPGEELFSCSVPPKSITGLSSEEYKIFVEKRIKTLKDDPFEVAAELLKLGDIKSFKNHVDTHLEALRKGMDKYGRSLAHIAVTHNASDNLSVIFFLRFKGFDFSGRVRDKGNYSPLMFSAWNAGEKVAKALIQVGADDELSSQELFNIYNNAKDMGRHKLSKSILNMVTASVSEKR